MVLTVSDKLKEEDFDKIRNADDKEIILDLKDVGYLGSRDITKLLVISREGKTVKFINANSHIIETLNVLKIEDIIKTV
jgi:hypothetical protein